MIVQLIVSLVIGKTGQLVISLVEEEVSTGQEK